VVKRDARRHFVFDDGRSNGSHIGDDGSDGSHSDDDDGTPTTATN
jgi:hypothetical protein